MPWGPKDGFDFHAYLQYYREKYSDSMRSAVVSVITLWVLLAALDIYKESVDERENVVLTLSLRGATTVLGVAGYLFFRRRAYLEQFTAVLLLTIGTVQMLFGYIEKDILDPTYSVVILFVSTLSATYFRLRFYICCLLMWSLFLIFLIITNAVEAYEEHSVPSHRYWFTLALMVVGNLIYTYQAYNREFFIRKGFLAAKGLELQEAKSQAVLSDMLPPHIIPRLRDGETFIYERHRKVSVLFSHIHDFDSHTASLTSLGVVTLLNNMFSEFDRITDEYGVYKVETIGDVFLCCAGCPTERRDHAAALCFLALDFHAVMDKVQMPGHAPVTLRIGINSGEVIAGVVGTRYPRYRLMGDTVNTASRMSTTCNEGDIQLSPTTYEALGRRSPIKCRVRKPIQVKGKGLMTNYLVEGVTDPEAQEAAKIGKKAAQEGGAGRSPPSPRAPAWRKPGGGGGALNARIEGTMKELIQAAQEVSDTDDELEGSGEDQQVIDPPKDPATVGVAVAPGVPEGAVAVAGSGVSGAPDIPPLPGQVEVEVEMPPVSLPRSGRRTSGPSHGRSASSGPKYALTNGGSSPSQAGQPSNGNGTTAAAVGLHVSPSTQPPSGGRRAQPGAALPPTLSHTHTANGQGGSSSALLAQQHSQQQGQSQGAGQGQEEGGDGEQSTARAPRGIVLAHDEIPAHYPLPASIQPIADLAALRRNANGTSRGSGLTAGGSSDLPPGAAPAPHPQRLHARGGSVSGLPLPIALPGRRGPSADLETPGHTKAAFPALADIGSVRASHARLNSNEEQKHLFGDQIVFGRGNLDKVRRMMAENVDPLFSLPPVEQLLANAHLKVEPSRPCARLQSWLRSISMVFVTHLDLELQFRQDYYQKFHTTNRRWILGLSVFFLLLGIYDHLAHASEPDRVIVRTWILRSVSVLVGLSTVLISYLKPKSYARWMQVMSSYTLTFMGIIMVQIGIDFDFYNTAYGVGLVLVLTSLFSLLVGMRFKSAAVSTLLVLLYYVIAPVALTDDIPSVAGFILLGNLFYIRSAYFSEFYQRRDFLRLLKQKNDEKRTSEFLANMLPAIILNELKGKTGDQLIVHEHKDASVLFCDIVGFTKISSQMTAEHVVAMLNIIFSSFDALTTMYNVYKVETIGDCYMACTGVVNPRPGSAQDLVDCALAFQTSTKRFFTPDRDHVIVRIGIHTGFVIAGVVGRKMPRYHLFGETVTIAEEVENKGLPGGVVVSGETYDHLDLQFECERLTDISLHLPAKTQKTDGKEAGAGGAPAKKVMTTRPLARYRVKGRWSENASKAQPVRRTRARQEAAAGRERLAVQRFGEGYTAPVAAATPKRAKTPTATHRPTLSHPPALPAIQEPTG